MSAFDNILEKKIGFGKYQYISCLLVGLTQFADGADVVGLSILLPVLKYEWNIPDDQQGLLGSMLFFGLLIGSLLGGYWADKYGRRTALLYSTFIQFVLGIVSTFASSVPVFLLIRALFGLVLGCTVPLGPSLTSEVTPVQVRGRAVVFINSMFSIGSLYGVIGAYFCLDSLTSGNWRALLIWCSVPALVVWLGSLKMLKESPRFLIAANRLEESIEVLNYMATVNNPLSPQLVSAEEAEELREWQRVTFNKCETSNIKTLFGKKYLRITVLVWAIFFTLNFAFYGMTFILPFILSQLEIENAGTGSQGISGLNGLALPIIGELPSLLIGLYIIEKKSFGRKNTVMYSSVITAILFLIAYVSSTSLLVPLLTIARMLQKLNFAIMLPLCTELYSTTVRGVGLGVTSGFGRLGSTIMPYILIAFLKIDVLFPIFCFAIFAALTAMGAFCLPYDTTGRHLDLMENQDEEVLSKSERKIMIAMKEF